MTDDEKQPATTPAARAAVTQRMVARMHDHVLRWRVQSVSRPEIEHVVELDAFHGNGRCSCEHFGFRLGPTLNDGTMRRGQASRCGHIKVAREAFANFMIQKLVTGERALAMEGVATDPCPACDCTGEAEDGTTCPLCEGTCKIPSPN